MVENHIFGKAVILKAAEKADFPAGEMMEVQTNIEVKTFLDDWIPKAVLIPRRRKCKPERCRDFGFGILDNSFLILCWWVVYEEGVEFVSGPASRNTSH